VFEMLENLREQETLPVGDEDRAIPTKVHERDVHIAFLIEQRDQLNRQIAEAEIDRRELLKRAKECHITTDAEYKIVEIPVYPKKHVDVEALKRLAPEKYNLIVQNLTSIAMDKLKDQMAKIQVTISQDAVKAVMTDKVLLKQIIPEQKVPERYDVSVVKR
jgi:hypothetical protein